MLIVSNMGPFSVELERGHPVAEAVRPKLMKVRESESDEPAPPTPHGGAPPEAVMAHHIVDYAPCVEPIPSSDPMAGFRLASGRLEAQE